jgi:hypothetical protein
VYQKNAYHLIYIFPLCFSDLGVFNTVGDLFNDPVGKACVFARFMLHKGPIDEGIARIVAKLPTAEQLEKFGLTEFCQAGTVRTL